MQLDKIDVLLGRVFFLIIGCRGIRTQHLLVESDVEIPLDYVLTHMLHQVIHLEFITVPVEMCSFIP